MNAVRLLTQRLNFDFGQISFSPSYLQAGVIILLLFVLILSLAQFRRHLVNWSVKGAFFGIFFGFLLALVFEGFLIIGGRTALTEVLGWKNAPEPIQIALEVGRGKLIQVLGIADEIPESVARSNFTAEDVIEFFQSLTPNEVSKVRKIICEP